ncbi:MAG: hypothetical protein ACI4RD_02920 [Kiritimatiellia bacterium]
MTIALVNSSVSPAVTTTLVDGQARLVGAGNWGKGIGPDKLRMSLAPGVVLREYVGADRVQGEHVRCDRGTVSFDVERIFATPEDALAYVSGEFLAEASEGALKFGDEVVFPQAAVTSRTAAVVGCAVAVSYTIEG